MGPRSGSSSGGKAPAPASSSLSPPRAVWLCLLMLLLLSRCSPCQGRKLLLLAQAEEEVGGGTGKVVHFEGDLALRVPPPPSVLAGDEPAASAVSVPAPVPRGFTGSRAARLMRSVPSPGIGH